MTKHWRSWTKVERTREREARRASRKWRNSLRMLQAIADSVHATILTPRLARREDTRDLDAEHRE